jgi:hypothetical protein
MEIVALDNMKSGDKKFDSTIIISTKVNELGNSGYRLVGQSSFASTTNVHITTYTFIKE